ncbi:MAG: hypothetical protein EBX50_20860 [Chitinophagia bacterium]|nr:hypothetical protein [Chitinophagia bacterium]
MINLFPQIDTLPGEYHGDVASYDEAKKRIRKEWRAAMAEVLTGIICGCRNFQPYEPELDAVAKAGIDRALLPQVLDGNHKKLGDYSTTAQKLIEHYKLGTTYKAEL